MNETTMESGSGWENKKTKYLHALQKSKDLFRSIHVNTLSNKLKRFDRTDDRLESCVYMRFEIVSKSNEADIFILRSQTKSRN